MASSTALQHSHDQVFYSALQDEDTKYRVVRYTCTEDRDGAVRSHRETLYSGINSEDEAERMVEILEQMARYLHHADTLLANTLND